MDITADTLDALYQNLNASFEKGINDARTIAEPLYEVVASTSDANAYSWMGHIPGFREWFKYQSRVIRNVKTYNYIVPNREFEDTISVHANDIADNNLNQFAPIAKNMGALGKLVPDELTFELLNNGFTTTKTYDDKTWFADDHTIGLSTIDNKRTAVLSETSLSEAIEALTGFTVKPDKLSKSRPLNPIADKLLLVVPPALKMTALGLVGKEYQTGGENNILYKMADVLSTSYLSSSTAWFLLNVGAPIKPIYMQDRESLTFKQFSPSDSTETFMKKEFLYGANCRKTALPTFPYLAIGSLGTG